jgi:hypothetical protein
MYAAYQRTDCLDGLRTAVETGQIVPRVAGEYGSNRPPMRSAS